MIDGLKEKVVIVTGGGHGIGRAYCHGFAEAGAKVVVADIDAPAADKVAAEVVQQFDGKALGVKVDVANEMSTKEMAKVALDKYGRIDILINNAAIFATIPMNRGGIDSIDPAEWDRMMAVNLKGLFFCCRAVLPAMRQQKSGKIVNISSGTALNGSAGFAPGNTCLVDDCAEDMVTAANETARTERSTRMRSLLEETSFYT